MKECAALKTTVRNYSMARIKLEAHRMGSDLLVLLQVGGAVTLFHLSELALPRFRPLPSSRSHT